MQPHMRRTYVRLGHGIGNLQNVEIDGEKRNGEGGHSSWWGGRSFQIVKAAKCKGATTRSGAHKRDLQVEFKITWILKHVTVMT